MDVTPLVGKNQQIIQRYTKTGFQISGKDFEGSVMIFPSHVLPWTADNFDSLNEDNFAFLLDQKDQIDVVLLGAGADFKRLPSALKSFLHQRGMSIDTMDTGAACRTYNVLMAEGRRVVAALLPAD